MSQEKRKYKISFMAVFSALLFVIGIFNLISCSGFTVYYYIKPADFAMGTAVNHYAFIIGIFGLYIMLILSLIYDLLLGKGAGRLITLNAINIPLYIVFAINLFYRLIFDPQLNVEGNATPAKIAANLALALLLNLNTVTMAFNYLRRDKI